MKCSVADLFCSGLEGLGCNENLNLSVQHSTGVSAQLGLVLGFLMYHYNVWHIYRKILIAAQR